VEIVGWTAASVGGGATVGVGGATVGRDAVTQALNNRQQQRVSLGIVKEIYTGATPVCIICLSLEIVLTLLSPTCIIPHFVQNTSLEDYEHGRDCTPQLS